MHPSPDTELNAVLAEFVKSIEKILGEKFLAAYLQGSFGVGDWDRDSDVDFTVVVSEDLSDSEVVALNANQARIFEMPSYWAKHLEGSFWPLELLKNKYANKNELWYFDNGSIKLERSTHDNTLVVRWVTHEHGITLAGDDAKKLLEPVNVDEMKQEIRNVMNYWGNMLFEDPEQMNNVWYQSFAVLSYCRMLHSLKTGRIHSKPASAAWAKANLDSRWIGLIHRAREKRKNQYEGIHKEACKWDFERTLDFIRYALELT